jgi:hypothetical protein
MEPGDQGAILQNVINSQGGNWSLFPEYCCESAVSVIMRKQRPMNKAQMSFFKEDVQV